MRPPSYEPASNSRGFADRRGALASGAIANVTESRAAEHLAERGTGNETAVAQATMLRQRMFGLISAIDAGAFGEIKPIIHVGIGGSALGPKLLMDALGRDEPKYQIHIASRISEAGRLRHARDTGMTAETGRDAAATLPSRAAFWRKSALALRR